MKRRARSVLGALGGILWGAGSAVLIQQFGLWPLDPLMAYGAPLVGALLSGAWGRRGSHRAANASVAALLLLTPAGVLAQGQPCEVVVAHADSGPDRLLSDTSPTDPFVIEPDEDAPIFVYVAGTDDPDRPAEAWVELGGFRILTHSGPAGDFGGEFELTNSGLEQFGGAPGIYRVGGSIEGQCSTHGYVRINANPWESPPAQAAGGAIIVGLGLTWFAGRPGGSGPAAPRRAGKLRPDGHPTKLDKVEIRSPGLEGDVTVHEPSEATIRNVGRWTDDTREALSNHHMQPETTVEITNTSNPGPVDHTMTTPHGEPAMKVGLPSPGPGEAQVLLATDESGALSWHFPRLDDGSIDTLRLQPTCDYFVPSAVPPAASAAHMRGLTQAFGTKVLTSLVFPLLDPAFERVGERFARVWELKRRPYRFRNFTTENYDDPEADEPDWDQIAAGKALIFIHGTFSRAHTGFGDLPAPVVADLQRMYEGRIFAFDHFTLSEDPTQNVAWFFDHLPEGIALDLDVVCHSRGGLVSRVLAEKQHELDTGNRHVAVDKIIFAASPNAGTVLAEPTYVGDLIDSYTNILNFVPGHHVVDVFEGVLTVVKHVAVGAVGGLTGLQAMRPGGHFLRWLNAPATNAGRYFAIAGDYEPQVEGWRRLAVDRLMDRVFKEPNDLVVPKAGTYAANGSSHFPIPIRHELGGDEGVDHTGYFADEHTCERLLGWLAD